MMTTNTRILALSQGWQPTPRHARAPLSQEQLAAIRASYTGTVVSLRALAEQLALPPYIVRETALDMGLRNTMQPARKRPVSKRRSYRANPSELEAAS